MSAELPTQDEIESRYTKLGREAEEGGYHLNPDREFTKNLVRGLLVNEKRYGYPSCPCRISFGIREEDRDIICPCDYRDPDLDQYNACYCALYVSEDVLKKHLSVGSIPERRPTRSERKAAAVKKSGPLNDTELLYPVWRCRVCGYLCARESPPLVCPVCKATKDRFERFI
ncbi:MAG: ferredoxin:glutaredoxin reductase [Methanoregulaceae archaeon]|jgi:ferredoxin-thioredoxin reductase catalytic subunit/rubredoxin|nr:ferredoxin:glutaredoxin reductase [Methanoregulaceae archaeon]